MVTQIAFIIGVFIITLGFNLLSYKIRGQQKFYSVYLVVLGSIISFSVFHILFFTTIVLFVALAAHFLSSYIIKKHESKKYEY